MRKYIEDERIIKVLVRQKFLSIRKLAALILWIKYTLKFRVTNIDLVEDLETGKLQFVTIHIEDCDQKGFFLKTIKEQLINEKFEDVTAKVVMVCEQAFQN